MDLLLIDLLNRLEAIAKRDQSLYDTAVREALCEAIFYLFIKPTPGYVLPDDYGMSDNDNTGIKTALQDYIKGAMALVPLLGLDTFHKRLEAFQNCKVNTGANNIEDFFGWINPNAFNKAGDLANSDLQNTFNLRGDLT